MDFLIRESALSWIYFVIAYSCILSFFHSSLFVFKRGTHKTKLTLQVPTILLWNSLPFHFFFIADSLAYPLLGLATGLSIVSLIVYWFSVHSIRNQRFAVIHQTLSSSAIYQKKIYSMVRHPFYFSYLLCYLGILLAVPNLIHLFIVSIIVVIYFRAAKKEEDNFLNGEFGSQYLEYMGKTGMFFPRLILKKNIK